MTEELREFVARSRARQGLPPRIEDPTALDRIADVFRLAEQEPETDGGGARAA